MNINKIIFLSIFHNEWVNPACPLSSTKDFIIRHEALSGEDFPDVPAPQAPIHLGQQRLPNETDEEKRLRIEVEVTSRLAAAFLEHAGIWEAMAEALSCVDVMLSFAAFAAGTGLKLS